MIIILSCKEPFISYIIIIIKLIKFYNISVENLNLFYDKFLLVCQFTIINDKLI